MVAVATAVADLDALTMSSLTVIAFVGPCAPGRRLCWPQCDHSGDETCGEDEDGNGLNALSSLCDAAKELRGVLCVATSDSSSAADDADARFWICYLLHFGIWLGLGLRLWRCWSLSNGRSLGDACNNTDDGTEVSQMAYRGMS